MKTGKQWQANWVMDPSFQGLKPIDILHKEMDKKEMEGHKEGLKNRHMLVRKTFLVEQLADKAIMTITADDYYKLTINGKFVGQGPSPGYHFNYKYNVYDITDFLKKGENVIGVHVYYQGLINRVWNSGDYRQGLIAEVHIDGNLYLMTDPTWKYQLCHAYKTRGTTGYDTQYLEDFDSRLYSEAWMTEAFDDEDWQALCVNDAYDYTFADEPSEPVSVYQVVAKKVDQYHKHTYLIDFGQEITGQFQMTAQGQPGQIIEVRCGEELDEADETHVRYKMRCYCDYQEYWTLSGQLDRLNNYDYKAFRYVEVIIPEGVQVHGDFSATVRHAPFDDSSFSYKSDNAMVDRIMTICKNGVKYGSQEVYVDCPSREKGQYLGDFTVTGHAHIYLTGKTELYKNALKAFADSSRICPGIMAVAPGGYMQEIADFSMQYPMQVYQYYRQTGDLSLLKDLYDTLLGLEAYFKAYERKDGLLEKVDEKWNLVDWPDNLRDDYDFDLTKPIGDGCHNVINAHYYGLLSYCDKIRAVLGIQGKHDLPKFRAAFIHSFYRSDKHLFVDSERSLHSSIHANALPLFYGMFPSEGVDEAVTLITNRAQHCGVQMSYFVLKALAKAGAYERVSALIEKLWQTMVKEGATTCFEAWGKDQKFNTSLCHPWASGPIPIMVEDIIGINPGRAGWEQLVFTPHIPESLKTFSLQLNLPCGRVLVKQEEGILRIELPKGVELIDEREKRR